MGFEPTHFRNIIRIALQSMELWCESSEELLMGTAAQETLLGRYLHQIGGGPARGVFQMEPATEKDIWNNYLIYRPMRTSDLINTCGVIGPSPWYLETNLAYQVIMARLKYRMIPAPLPSPSDSLEMGEYWDKWFNCNPNKGTPDEFRVNYLQLCFG